MRVYGLDDAVQDDSSELLENYFTAEGRAAQQKVVYALLFASRNLRVATC